VRRSRSGSRATAPTSPSPTSTTADARTRPPTASRRSAGDLARIDRKLLASLETLEREAVKARVRDWLTNGELDAMMKRRDLLVAHFKGLIDRLGEDKVLY
jgi:hypothetical protein